MVTIVIPYCILEIGWIDSRGKILQNRYYTGIATTTLSTKFHDKRKNEKINCSIERKYSCNILLEYVIIQLCYIELLVWFFTTILEYTLTYLVLL